MAVVAVRRRRRVPLVPGWAILPLVAVCALAVLPVYYVVARARLAGWSEIRRLLFRARVAELLSNTARLTIGVTFFAVVLGVAAAFLVERTDLPGRRWWRGILPLPLAVPAFVTTYGWVALTRDVQTFWGAVGVLTLSYYPLVLLPVGAALRGLDPVWEESARSLGLGPATTFRRVVLPLLRPAIAAGALLVALEILSEFGALALLRYDTFTTAIFTQYQLTFDSSGAAALAGVLIVLCLVVLVAELGLRGRARYARVGAGAARTTPLIRLGWRRVPTILLMVTLLALALGVPIGTVVYWGVTGSSTRFPLESLATATFNAVTLSLGGAVLAVALAMPVALVVVRRRSWLSTSIERLSYLGGSLPGLVVALALVFVSIRALRPLYQTRLLLVIAYTSLFLPLAVATVRPRVAQAPARLEEIARSLGRRPWRATLSVTVPVIAPGLGAAAALVFLAAMRELTATLLLRPTGVETLATEVWAATSNLSYGAAAPYALLLIAVCLPATYLLTRFGDSRERLSR